MRSWKRWAALLPVIAAVALIWPMCWGGQLGYVTTRGISMEPKFHTGDLAVVHPQRDYRVGEITAYH
ncbi:MAG: S24 family peptidase, partial [Frankiales bacterium]|nr:S24 family peptidase [Frankiales bacterium]